MLPVKMFSTAWCPYCIEAKALLKQRGVEAIDDVRVDLDPTQRQAMIELTGRVTVPQIFIGATHVGGCDDLVALDRRGELLPLLAGTPSGRDHVLGAGPQGPRASPIIADPPALPATPQRRASRSSNPPSNPRPSWLTTTTRYSRSSAST